MKEISLFSPATVANLTCGFDVLGLALEGIGDEITIRTAAGNKINIEEKSGYGLPLDPEKNVAGLAVKTMLHALDLELGLDISITKGVKPGSGIGSSAASAAGAVWGLNELLNTPFSIKELISFAMEGERIASGEATADNVAPALLGGITLVRSQNPLDVIELHVPPDLYVIVVHPHIEIRTEDARSVLTSGITLKQGIQQWANVGALVAGLYKEDYALIGRSLVDVIVEPQRSHLIPNYKDFKTVITEHQALGGGISGSGPSVYCLCKGADVAGEIAVALKELYGKSAQSFDLYTSAINLQGCRKLV